MNYRSPFLCKLTVCLLLYLAPQWPASGSDAAEFDEIAAEIRARAGGIAEAKAQGLLIEGSDGRLMPAKEISANQAELLRQENLDRQRMFRLIARRTSEEPDDVANLFARMARSHGTSANAPFAASHAPTAPAPASGGAGGASEERQGSPPDGATAARILTRPGAVLREGPAETSSQKADPLPAFTTLDTVRYENGWYQIGSLGAGSASGWVNERDAIVWKHNLVACFTHPDGRNRALIFRDKSAVARLAGQVLSERSAATRRLLDALSNSGRKEEAADLLGVEPAGWARLQDQSYMLPVIDHQMMDVDGRDALALRVAAITGREGRPRPEPNMTAPRIDLVFVMDLSRSMGPFVERTQAMLAQISSSLAGMDIAPDAVAFGLWGYRDDPKLCQGIEFNTRNFTPELQALQPFTATLDSVRETKVDSIDYAEDVLAGVTEAITATRWRENSLRLILLVGDAPGRDHGESEPECNQNPRPRGTACEMRVEEVREFATAQSVILSSIYLEAPRWSGFTERAERQFKILSRNPSSDVASESYALINATRPDDYAACARAFASQLAENLKSALARKTLPTAAAVPSGQTDPGAAGRQMADNAFRGAFIEWVSSQKDLAMPADIDGWLMDKDPADPLKTALDAGVLLNRDQLDSLRRLTDDLVNALIRVQLSSEDFFAALQAVAVTGAHNPQRLREAKNLQQTGMIPQFLMGLPYKSRVMDFSSETWRSMSGDEQDQFLRTVESKLRYYQGIYNDAPKWVKLNPNDDEGAKVYAVPLKNLP